MSNQKLLLAISLVVLLGCFNLVQAQEKPLILQEMSWLDVQEYLKMSDMVIIPLGSTEQHGRHLPLGTDYYEAFGMCQMISKRTGVVIAPVLFVGYSEYHSGFPGTLSLKPETMEQVLFETAEILMKYGFRRFMFFSYHGGNNIVQQKIIHRINHTTAATAIAIGIGGSVQKSDEDGEFFDWHAGKSETSIMLYLKPEFVKLERAEKPEIRLTPQVQELYELSKKYPELGEIAGSMLGVPTETKKAAPAMSFPAMAYGRSVIRNLLQKRSGKKQLRKWLIRR